MHGRLLLVAALILCPNALHAQDEYTDDLNLAVQELQKFWVQEFPRIDQGHRAFPPLAGVYEYDAENPDSSIPCQPQGINAFYCGREDVLLLEEPHLLRRWYEQYGDFTTAFVVAHEWGHAIQHRLGIDTLPGIPTIAMELQADCFAGAWTAYAEDQAKIIEPGDIDEAVEGLLNGRDTIGTSWLDPTAHGTGAERIEAMLGGRRGGSSSCIGGPMPKIPR